MRFVLTIRRRLILGFLLLIALVLVASAAGLVYTRSADHSVTTIRDGVSYLQRESDLETAWSAVLGTTDNLLLTRQTTLIEGRLASDLATFDQRLTDLQNLPLGEDPRIAADNQAIIDSLVQLTGELDRVIGDIEAAAVDGQWATAQRIRHADLASLDRRYADNFNRLSANVQTTVDSSVADAEDARDTNWLILILVVALALSAGSGAAYLTSRSIIRPLSTLLRAIQAVEKGDLSQQVNITSRDEIGVLAHGFNLMIAQLDDLINSLEARVQARTRDMQIAAQVSEQIATVLDPDQLLLLVVELTKSSYDLYHTHVYLLGEGGESLVLSAGAGEVGRMMKERGHSIPAGARRSLVARAARENKPVIVADTTQEPGFLANPLLPKTRSEAALPLAVGNRVLGVLDVQSDRIGHFDTDLLPVLSTLAGQIAVAIENARLFSTVEQSSRYEQALSTITQSIQRATSMDEVLQLATRELGRALRVPYTAIELQVQMPVDEPRVPEAPVVSTADQDENYAANLEAAPH